MSYIQKTVSCKAILAKIGRTFKPSNSGWIIEAIEDIGWAIQAIGYHAGFEKKDSGKIQVTNHRYKIPCDLERITAVGYFVPSGTGDNILNPDGSTPDISQEDDAYCGYKEVKLLLGSDLTGYGLSTDNPRTTSMTPATPYYNLNPDYIITSFETGQIRIYGVGFSVDKEGFPTIIDDFDYKSCVEWYIVSQMILSGYKNPEINYKMANEMFDMYRKKAEAACKVPSLDGMERFAASWLRFSGTREVPGDFFMNMEQKEYKHLT